METPALPMAGLRCKGLLATSHQPCFYGCNNYDLNSIHVAWKWLLLHVHAPMCVSNQFDIVNKTALWLYLVG